MNSNLSLEPPNLKNNFSFLGIDIIVDDNPKYIHVYEFEKLDYRHLHQLLEKCLPIIYGGTVLYLVIVFSLQKWMEKRQPYELRKSLFVWNVLLAGISVMMFARFLPEMIHIIQTFGFYNSYCKREYVNSATLFWMGVYFISKAFEFFDTAFIILRKQKLTFLHVFHHSSVFIACALGMHVGDYTAKYFALMNSFVHSVMYSYYALKVAQFKLPRKLAMVVTSVQMIQFSVACIINVLVVYHKLGGTNPTCDRPDSITVLYGALAFVYFCLFGNFFLDSYVRRKPVKTKEQ